VKAQEFFVKDRRFAVLTLEIDGGIRVGDPLSKLDNFKSGKPLYVKEGIIIAIFYDYPV